MAGSHDRAAERAAKKLGGSYDATDSPDVKGKGVRAEVKSKASEIPTAVDQLGKGSQKKYLVLPQSEIPEAQEKLKGSGIGILNYRARIVKRATTKK